MQATEWRQIVAKLNASYPGQEISPETAAEWYTELAHRDAGDVWLAIRELRTECKWRPSLAEILAGIAMYRRALAEQARSQDRIRALGRRGTPMPPETRQAIEILTDSLGTNPKVDKAQARAMLDTLGERLTERVGPGWEVAS